MRNGLVVHAPATANDLEPTLVDQIPHDVAFLLALTLPPFPQEGGFDVDEP